jgi:N-carbamoyl-L-amino-acid hydrolase
MRRIGFILIFASVFFGASAQSLPPANSKRMEARILELGTYGRNPQGGVSRLAFSEADKQGRAYIIGLMKNAGLLVRVDAAANIIGRRIGKNPALPVIAFGSHIDSVPFGGNYDGDVGVIGALECIELLKEANIQTDHPLEVIVFTNEEGGLTGSTAMMKQLDDFSLDEVSNSGKVVRQGLRELGGDISKLNTAVRSKDELAAFLELHIEQGGVLDKSNLQIGVVEGIVGIEQWDVTIQGRANHAGTTPMALRQDAMLSAAKFTLAVNEVVRSIPGGQVGTVGRIRAEPGAPNVIPGRVILSLELRDLSREKIYSVFEKIKLRVLDIDKECGTNTSFKSINSAEPAITDKHIQGIIAGQAQALGLSYKIMPSGAGHDSQDMAKIVPTGMIFVPSKDGVSHAPDEYTAPQAMANGANVLLRTILMIDKGK